MERFVSGQKIFEIGGIQVGGQPGELPTVLIGSIFYEGHKIVLDPTNGIFDKKRAEELITNQDEISKKTANPCMVDVVALAPQAMQKYIEFVAETTKAPILVDSSSVETKIAGLKYSREIGLNSRIVYNSINYHFDTQEISALKESKVNAAIILTYNPRNVMPNGRTEILKGTSTQKGLLKTAEDAGVEKPLIDTAVLDAPSIGLAAEAITLVKSEFGLPCGAGPVNAVSEWKRVEELGIYAKQVCMANAVTALQHAGANFVLYGPIGKAETVFPAAAMTDALIAYSARFHGIRLKTKEHPLLKIF